MPSVLQQLLTLFIALAAVFGGTFLLDLPQRATTGRPRLFLPRILVGVVLLATSLTTLQALHRVLFPEQALSFWFLGALVILPFGIWYVTQTRPHPLRNALAYVGMLVAVHLSLFVNSDLPPTTETLLRMGLCTGLALLATAAASLVFKTTLSVHWRLGTIVLGYTAATLLISGAFSFVALPLSFHSWSSISIVVVLGFLDLLLLGLFLSAQTLRQDTQRQAAALSLEYAVQQLLSEQLNDAVVICDAQGQVIRLNARATQNFALTRTPERDVNQWYDTTFSGPLDLQHAPLNLALGGVTIRNALYGLESTGERRIVRCNAGPLLGPHQEALGAVMTLTDVTSEVEAQATQQQMAQQYSEIVDALDEGVILISPEGQVLQRNARLHQLLGLPEERILSLEDLLRTQNAQHLDGQPVTVRGENFRRLVAGQALVTEELIQVDRLDHRTVFLRVRGQALQRQGKVYAVLYAMTDISDQLTLHQEIARLANHVILTGLPNRPHFLERAAAARRGPDAALLILQSLASTAFRQAGRPGSADALIQVLSHDLPLAYPKALLLGQLHEDTFVLLLPHAVTRLDEDLQHAIQVQDEQVEPRFRAATRPLSEVEDLDLALQETEATLAHTVEGQLGISAPAQYQAQLRQVQLERRLRVALKERSFTVYFQPIYHLQDQQIREAEALIRWFDAELGFVPPDTFIPLLEAWNRIHPVTDLVIEAALVESRRISALAGYTVRIAINLSAVELNAPDFLARMEALTQRVPDASLRLTFEVTERGVLNHLAEVTRRLNVLRDLGFCLALDDFGTGYSALSVLQSLPVHFVKLDRSFVQGIEASARLQVLTDAVMQLARRLQFEVIAEGIETREQEEILRRSGCELGQGYLFARPQAHLEVQV